MRLSQTRYRSRLQTPARAKSSQRKKPLEAAYKQAAEDAGGHAFTLYHLVVETELPVRLRSLRSRREFRPAFTV